MFEKIGAFFKRKVDHDFPKCDDLKDCHAAILATDGFEESELFVPQAALEAAGCKTHVVSLRKGRIRGQKNGNWARFLEVDHTVVEAQSMAFDFLLLPGGVINPDKLRNDRDVVEFVTSFVQSKLPIAAICHGVQTLVETGLLKGRHLTSWPSIKTDLLNAGAIWSDQEVVTDHLLVTGRGPDGLPSFVSEMVKVFSYGRFHKAIPNVESFISIR